LVGVLFDLRLLELFTETGEDIKGKHWSTVNQNKIAYANSRQIAV
jgi:hypothetical protein